MSTLNIRIQRYNNSGGWDILHPETGLQNVIGLMDGETIAPQLLPDYLFSGMKYCGTINTGLTHSTSSLFNQISYNPAGSIINTSSYVQLNRELKGNILMCLVDCTITKTNTETYGAYKYTYELIGQEGEKLDEVHAEKADWVIFNGITYEAYNKTFTLLFAVINNSYELASPFQYGLVKIANEVNSTGASAVTQKAVATYVSSHTSGYITKDVNNLTYYYDKSTTDSLLKNKLSKTDASNTYLTKDNAQSIYAPKSSPTFTGTVTLPSLLKISGNTRNGFVKLNNNNLTVSDTSYITSSTFNSHVDSITEQFDGLFDETEIIKNGYLSGATTENNGNTLVISTGTVGEVRFNNTTYSNATNSSNGLLTSEYYNTITNLKSSVIPAHASVGDIILINV